MATLHNSSHSRAWPVLTYCNRPSREDQVVQNRVVMMVVKGEPLLLRSTMRIIGTRPLTRYDALAPVLLDDVLTRPHPVEPILLIYLRL